MAQSQADNSELYARLESILGRPTEIALWYLIVLVVLGTLATALLFLSGIFVGAFGNLAIQEQFRLTVEATLSWFFSSEVWVFIFLSAAASICLIAIAGSVLFLVEQLTPESANETPARPRIRK